MRVIDEEEIPLVPDVPPSVKKRLKKAEMQDIPMYVRLGNGSLRTVPVYTKSRYVLDLQL